MTYPISELFHSVQGEGVYTGTPMCFVRLAGCNVGKYNYDMFQQRASISFVQLKAEEEPLAVQQKHSICTTVDGQRFLCDTDYHKTCEMTIPQIMEQVYEDHICLTGGEPFLHKLGELMEAVSLTNKQLHIETSGTLPIRDVDGAWITCCPKEGFLLANIDFIDEFKFLVGPDFNDKVVDQLLASNPNQHRPVCIDIYLQPINGVAKVDEANLALCLKLLEKHPNWKLSAQTHKYWKVR